ncbi:MAG: hypothetical protein E6F93_09230 [Actinobacteria bacterium]|nr:MAG: hypothetical protein E6F93_09230 [Actinomycetota bacterium]
MRDKAVAVLVAFAAVAVALVVALPAGAAGNAGTTQVSTFDPTGAVFTCPGTDYTILPGGTIRSVFHDSFAANGSEHVTGTISPIGVALTDGTTNTVYRLSGASWFGGNLNYVNGKYEFADTEFFNILAPSGGVVAKVAGVEHAGSGGSNFSFTFGQCEAPQD